jgi:hypothetical protein
MKPVFLLLISSMLLMSSVTVHADTLQWKTSFDEPLKLLENEQDPFQTTTTEFGTMRDWSEWQSRHVYSPIPETKSRSSLAFDADEQDDHDYFDNSRGHDVDDRWHPDPPSPAPEPGSAMLLVIGLAILLTVYRAAPASNAQQS